MGRTDRIAHKFVEFIPTELDQGTVYISLEFATAAHLCCCGCGMKVVTPFSPTDWRLIFDGESVSLSPSIGNWGFPCRSHYWIRRGRVQWDEPWTDREVVAGRDWDRAAKARHYSEDEDDKTTHRRKKDRNLGWLGRITTWFGF